MDKKSLVKLFNKQNKVLKKAATIVVATVGTWLVATGAIEFLGINDAVLRIVVGLVFLIAAIILGFG